LVRETLATDGFFAHVCAVEESVSPRLRAFPINSPLERRIAPCKLYFSRNVTEGKDIDHNFHGELLHHHVFLPLNERHFVW